MYKAVAIVASTLALAMPAQAARLRYLISGSDTLAGNQIEFASFRVDQNPTPDGTDPAFGFFIAAVPGTYTYGSTTTSAPQDISFYISAYDGGLFVGEGNLLGFGGPQLFSGTLDHPTLLTGSFQLTDYFSGSPIALTVTAVPEPASWALMIAGFALVGGLWRSRRDVDRVVSTRAEIVSRQAR